MKIVYYSSHPHLNLASPSGYGTHMREMIAAFRKLGHEVKPVIMGGNSIDTSNLAIKTRSPLKQALASIIPAYAWETAKDYKVQRFDKHAFKTLEAEIETFKPDLIYERATYLQTSGVQAAQKRGVKHILEVNAPYVEERKAMQGNSYFLQEGIKVEKELLEKTNKIVVVSSALKSHLINTYKISAGKFVITPNAINPEHLQFDAAKVVALKAALQLENKTVIGFVGSIFPWHGVDILIAAFEELAQAGKQPVHLLIVGDGEILPLLIKQASEAGLADEITFTGNVPHKQVFDYLQLMDICVMGKSNWYGSPVKIFEYGAMGKAIIAPDNVPVRDVMQNGITGLLVQPSVESLTQALILYLENDRLRKSCATTFKELTLNKYTWKHNAELVLSAIK